MGKTIAILVLLALLLLAAIWQSIYIHNTTDTLTEQLEQVVSALEQNDIEKAAQGAKDFDDAWQLQKQTYETLFEHKEVDIISATAQKLPSLCDPDCVPEARAAAEEMLFYIEHIRDIDRLSWENVF